MEEYVETTAEKVDPPKEDVDDDVAFDRGTRMTRRESVREKVESLKPLVLSFENLTVLVGQDSPLSTLTSAKKQMGLGVDEQGEFYALYGVSGFVKTEEIVLVLSSDTQSSSSLIRAVSSRLNSQDDLSGSLYLNGMPLLPSYWQRWRRMCSHVAATDSSHAPNLTVRETFYFAAQCNCPADIKEGHLVDVVDDLLEMLDLVHVQDTVVGDENLRGISGGQKRRVTVGEMLLGSSKRFMALENITDGLSSKDSYNLVKELQNVCETYKRGALISLLQPSDEIVELFDKLLILDDQGGLAYFGPPDREFLSEVFLEKNKEDDPLALDGSICDLVLRPENSTGDVTSKQRFQTSDVYKRMHQELTAMLQQPQDHSVYQYLPVTKYSSGWRYQFKIIGRRRLKLIKRNAATYVRVGIAIAFGIVIGSIFSDLNQDLVGSLSRTGFLFVTCFLTLTLSAAFTIPLTFRERTTLYKHRSSEFFSGRVAYVTVLLFDVPSSILEALLLSIISYSWADMNADPGRYFYFFIVLVCLEMVGQALARFLTSVTRKQVMATTISSAVMLVFGSVAGFMPGFTDIPVILRWMSWFTPASYAFEGVMINQFEGQDILLGSAVPGDALASSAAYMEGTAWLAAQSLPRRDWASFEGIMVFNIFMILVQAAVLDSLGCYFTERNREWYFNQIHRLQMKAISTHFKEKDTPQANKQETAGNSENRQWPSSLSVKDISYFVPVKGAGELQLLTSVNARFACGRMTALMGTSGAGKTTLLDVIAGYKTGGRIGGDIMLDGALKDAKAWKYISGYAEQNDILNPHLSAIETLRFTAACRLPGTVNRNSIIDNVVRLMELENWTDNLVGREIEQEGLPKHARKRLTIAVQLVLQPKILFLDEPTTGLGTSAANLVIQAIRRVTSKMNLITVATIHQPSKPIWDTFDDLILLTKGGVVTYMGEMGPNSRTVLDYFSELSGAKTASTRINPADFVIAAVTSVSVDEASNAFKKYEGFSNLVKQIDADINTTELTSKSKEAMEKLHKESGRGQNPFRTLFLLIARHTITQWRDTSYSVMRVVASLIMSLYMGILFSSASDLNISAAVFSIGAICFFVYILLIPMRAAIIPLVEDRAVLYRETMSGLYSRFTYGLGNLLADIPFHILNALVMFVMFYFLVGFRDDLDRIGYFILLIFMCNWVIMSLGQLYALIFPNEESAIGVAGLSHFLSVLLMGFLIMERALPDGWLWAYWANVFHYIMQGFVTNQLAGTNYLLIPPRTINDTVANGSTAFLFESGTDLSNGSVAEQSATFMNMALLAAPVANFENRSLDYDWESSGIVNLGQWVDCMITNDCFVDPVAENFIRCNIIDLPRGPVCSDEFESARVAIDAVALFQCFDPISDSLPPSNPTNVVEGVPDDFTIGGFRNATKREQLAVVLCLMAELLPPDLVSDVKSGLQKLIEQLTRLLDSLYGVVLSVIGVLESGVYLPGEVILWVFRWAEFEDGAIVASHKWHYCMTAVAVFIGGIEIFKLLAICLIVWTKR